MDVFWKGLLGGLLTAAIVLASKRGDVLPGILPLIPIFAVIALLAVGAKGDPVGFRTACLAIAKTVPAYVVFLGACYVLIGRLDYRLAIIGGMGAWLAVAVVIFLAPRGESGGRPNLPDSGPGSSGLVRPASAPAGGPEILGLDQRLP